MQCAFFIILIMSKKFISVFEITFLEMGRFFSSYNNMMRLIYSHLQFLVAFCTLPEKNL